MKTRKIMYISFNINKNPSKYIYLYSVYEKAEFLMVKLFDNFPL